MVTSRLKFTWTHYTKYTHFLLQCSHQTPPQQNILSDGIQSNNSLIRHGEENVIGWYWQYIAYVLQYVGQWFEVERMRQVFEPFAACVTADYTLVDIVVSGITYPVTVLNRMTNDLWVHYKYVLKYISVCENSGRLL